MKKTVIISTLFLFLPLLIFSKSLEQQWLDYANKCYQNQNYSKAASAYDTVLKINPNNISALTYGGYTYITLGNAPRALRYLQKAFEISGDESIKTQIDNIKATTGAQAETPEVNIPPLPGEAKTQAKAQNDSPFKWILLGSDVVLAGLTVFNYMNFNSAANSYDSKYAQIDNTTTDNYNTLMGMRNSAEGKYTTYEIFGGLTAAAVVYTLTDMFFIHAAFPATVSINSQNKQVMLTLKQEF